MQNVVITISGRISNYFFGCVLPEYLEEFEKAMEYVTDEDIETLEEFIVALHATTLEDVFDNGIEDFKGKLKMDEIEANCPKLYELLNDIEEQGMGHYNFYEAVLDAPFDDVHVIENDSYITITVDNEEIISQQKLEEFIGEVEDVDFEEDQATGSFIQTFWDTQKERFGISAEELEDISVTRSENGALLISNWFEPKKLKDYVRREHNITVDHDNIVDLDFYIQTKNFEVSKLAFLQYANMDDFRNSAPEYIGSYVFYDNEYFRPEQNIARDKGITLQYEPDYTNLTFLIEG
jgi:hypothetical protein